MNYWVNQSVTKACDFTSKIYLCQSKLPQATLALTNASLPLASPFSHSFPAQTPECSNNRNLRLAPIYYDPLGAAPRLMDEVHHPSESAAPCCSCSLCRKHCPPLPVPGGSRSSWHWGLAEAVLSVTRHSPSVYSGQPTHVSSRRGGAGEVGPGLVSMNTAVLSGGMLCSCFCRPHSDCETGLRVAICSFFVLVPYCYATITTDLVA